MNHRTIDALVAQARGVTPYHTIVSPYGARYGSFENVEEARDVIAKHCDGVGWQIVPYINEPPVSTDIAEAMALVDELEAAGYRWSLNVRDPVKSDLRIIPHMRFWRYRDGLLDADMFYADGDTRAEAICLAFLKAKGVEVQNE
jgi:hypothetical protein